MNKYNIGDKINVSPCEKNGDIKEDSSIEELIIEENDVLKFHFTNRATNIVRGDKEYNIYSRG